MKKEEKTFRTVFAIITAALCFLCTLFLICFYQLRSRANAIEWYGIVATFLVGTAASFLLGPQALWIAVVMMIMSAAALYASFKKLDMEMSRANARYYYNKDLRGPRVRFLTPKHVIDVIMPFSFLLFSVAYMYEMLTEGGFGFRVRIVIRSCMLVVACVVAVSGQIKEIRNYWWKDRNVAVIRMNPLHTMPRNYHDMIFADETEVAEPHDPSETDEEIPEVDEPRQVTEVEEPHDPSDHDSALGNQNQHSALEIQNDDSALETQHDDSALSNITDIVDQKEQDNGDHGDIMV